MNAVEEIKEAVRERDGRRCVECGFEESQLARHVHSSQQRHKRLDVHRIDADGPYSLENCITLCRSCHCYKRRDYEFIGVINGRKRFRKTIEALQRSRYWEMRLAETRKSGRPLEDVFQERMAEDYPGKYRPAKSAKKLAKQGA